MRVMVIVKGDKNPEGALLPKKELFADSGRSDKWKKRLSGSSAHRSTGELRLRFAPYSRPRTLARNSPPNSGSKRSAFVCRLCGPSFDVSIERGFVARRGPRESSSRAESINSRRNTHAIPEYLQDCGTGDS